MSGILDPKERILDVMLTEEGRRKLASAGSLGIAYASFTDSSAFYEKDLVSGSTDAGVRLSLEATNTPYDQVTFLSDDSGKLRSSKHFIDGVGVINGKAAISVGPDFMNLVTGSIFVSSASSLLGASSGNLRNLRLLMSRGPFDDDEFVLSRREISFAITDDAPIPRDGIKVARIEKADDLLSDRRLSRLPNFLHLPPVNMPRSPGERGAQLGNYPPIGSTVRLGDADVMREFLLSRDSGHAVDVEFVATSRQNNLLCQMFEIGDSEIVKLDVIDFGRVIGAELIGRAFFVGKLFVNGDGVHTFIHMFTVIFYDPARQS